MMDYQKIGVLIYELRKEKNITQKQLAEILQVTESTIGNYEINRIRPSHEILLAIAEYFDVSLDELYGRY